MSLLLDTNVVSELRRIDLGRAHPNVARWSNGSDRQTWWLSAITVLEVELGILLAERRDPRQGRSLRTLFSVSMMPQFSGRVLSIDLTVALCCASLHVPDPRPERDAYIASTALVHDMTVVTRNVRDFAGTGVRVVDPLQP